MRMKIQMMRTTYQMKQSLIKLDRCRICFTKGTLFSKERSISRNLNLKSIIVRRDYKMLIKIRMLMFRLKIMNF